MLQELLIDLLVSFSLTAFGSILIASHIKNTYLKLATSFILGHGLFAFLLFLLSLFVSINISHLWILFFFTYLILFWQHRLLITSFIKRPIASISQFKFSLRTVLPFVALVIVLIPHFYNTFFWPVLSWDSITLYDFRGHQFAQEGQLLANPDSFGPSTYYFSYPPLTSLIHGIYYLLGATSPQTFYPLLFLSFVTFFYFSLPPIGSFWLIAATIAACFNLQAFSHINVAYTNLPYLIYYCCGIIFLTKFIQQKKNHQLILGLIMLGLSAFTRKDDPFWIPALLSFVVVALIYRKTVPIPIFPALFGGLSFFFLRQSWLWFTAQKYTLYQNYPIAIGLDSVPLSEVLTGITPYKIVEVSIFLLANLKLPLPIVAAVLIGATIFILKKQKSPEFLFLLLLFVFNTGILFIGTLYFSAIYSWWRGLSDSVSRMTMFIYPLLVYFAIQFLPQKTKK